MTYLQRTYGAGFRGGMAPKALQIHADGSKTIIVPTCPYPGRFQIVARFLYWEGYQRGLYCSLRRWVSRHNRRIAV